MNSEEKHFIVGLIVGEGSFSVTMKEDEDYNVNIGFSSLFTLTMHEENEEMMDEIFELFDIKYFKNKKGDENQYRRYFIQGFERCGKLVDVINSVEHTTLFKKSEKYSVFKKWGEYVKSYSPPQTEEEAKNYIDLSKSLNKQGNGGKSKEHWYGCVNVDD